MNHLAAHDPSHRVKQDPGLVATLAYDGLCLFEFGIAQEIFGLARPEFDFPWYQHQVVGVDKHISTANGCLHIQVDAGIALLEQAKTIVIPGWRCPDALPSPALIDALQQAFARGTRIISICSGVFVLAAAGLLRGKSATTHWRYSEYLAQHYPDIHVDANVLYVDEGQIITSAGSSAGIDACLHLITRDFGTQIANQVARRLVMAPQRRGGQQQFIPTPVVKETHRDIAKLMEQVREKLDKNWSINQMAAQLALSERTFLRRFYVATGQTPKIWLQHERMHRAKELLERDQINIAGIAEHCGFQTIEGFRNAFRQIVGITPAVYRRQFKYSE
ncbi:transcriptional regulator FtrA [Yersinia kristensenii]|uniref:transcriptional regulator FtrA n=1 Tax=Yersinia kristensenii TaxID=28152 RepID=UPI001427AFA9|nr:transcriptional regulator FtrA [Yersinia kristensenii]MDA5473862.1 transcriptional regulator FtrA [Yersinia kristensenii]MDA5478481.1 transcriptional regulator FtrA [Yersinia kristensenii]MDA5506787.1 transcriptional regulator FtrA [Yersinia kristensenii]NIK96615.1 transcriptional regulator FtrA [Yersinia kristensenii]NIL07458.1 transcriptional regulator FtrA [Yersinia kristensenii]